jgi:hypothetical protein
MPGLSGVSDASPFLFCVVVCGPLFVFPFYYFPSCEFECCSWQGALDALLCDHDVNNVNTDILLLVQRKY